MTEKEHVKKKYVKIRFMNTEKKSFKKSGIIFLILVVILFAFVFHSVSLNEVIESIRQTDQPFIILGMLMIVTLHHLQPVANRCKYTICTKMTSMYPILLWS